jgi:hypothetical protein
MGVMWWWLYIAAYLLLFFMVLLLPTGRLRSRRWRWAGWLGVCCIALIVPSLLARRPLHPKLPAITNPVGLLPPSPVLDLLDHVAEDVLFPLLGVAVVASLVLHFRTARGVEATPTWR